MKKILSVFMALLLLLPSGIRAFANQTATITITNTTENTGIILKDEVYSAYKVMDFVQGSGYTVNSDFAKFFTDMTNYQGNIDAFANNYFSSNSSNMVEVARDIANYIKANNIVAPLERKSISNTLDSTNLVQKRTITNLPLGYYIIVDQTTGAGHTLAAGIIGNVVSDLNIDLKASKPTTDKEIYHNEKGSWGKVSDNQIGDEVEFRLIGNLPKNIIGYKNYTYILHDTLEEGKLEFSDNIEVYVGEGKTSGNKLVLGTDYTVAKAVSHPTDGNDKNNGTHSFDLKLNLMVNGSLNPKLTLGGQIYVYYTAKLLQGADIAGGHNDNEVYLEYSNNPYDENSTEKGPKKIVYDYTFRLNVTKNFEGVANDAIDKPNAEFNILKDGTELYFVRDKNDETKYIVSKKEATGATKTINSGGTGNFYIVGLDDAVQYTLRETKAPLGYNSISDKSFTIKADYNDSGEMINLEASEGSGIAKIDGKYELGTTIENKKGSLLPSTGGIGTTLFSIAGGSLMLSALGLVILKRRKNI